MSYLEKPPTTTGIETITTRRSLSRLDLRTALEHHRARSSRCLLIDVSASMRDKLSDGRRKIDRLREIVREFPNERIFSFSAHCQEVRSVPEPQSNTDMAGAFRFLQSQGLRHAVLVTDGLPDDEDDALKAACGIQLDIFYVGPAPAPDFLERLARATGGSFSSASLDQPKLLSQRIAGLLTGR